MDFALEIDADTRNELKITLGVCTELVNGSIQHKHLPYFKIY